MDTAEEGVEDPEIGRGDGMYSERTVAGRFGEGLRPQGPGGCLGVSQGRHQM